jgi:hypothetical protein
MRVTLFVGILVTYIALLFVTGYLTFVRFPGMPTLPTPPMVADLAGDPDFKADLLEDVRTARQRSGDLIKLAAHSFDVILGALLGFLSAVAATTGLTGGTQTTQRGTAPSRSLGTSDVPLQASDPDAQPTVPPDPPTAGR